MSEYIVELTAKLYTDLRFKRREEIVRCGDCKYADEVTWPASSKVPPDYLDCGGPLVETWDYYNDEPKDNHVPPNGFCFCGERRDA